MTAPQIITYVAIDPDAPSNMGYAAAMVSDSRPGTSWMAYGSSPDVARGKLEAIWAKANPGPSKRGKHLKNTAETVDDLIVL